MQNNEALSGCVTVAVCGNVVLQGLLHHRGQEGGAASLE